LPAGNAPLAPSVAKFIHNQLQAALPKETLARRDEGLHEKEIADRISVSPHTVVTCIKRIHEKLNVANAPAARQT
jgi:DNA-binding NarL/FixJ family response regulator